MEPIIVGLVWIGLAVGVAVGAVVLLRRRAAKERMEAEEIEALKARAVGLLEATADASSSGLEDRKGQTPREVRDQWLRERQATKHCRYCDEDAVKQFPTFKPVRPMFDWVLRHLNATPNNRWKIQLDRDPSIVYELCEQHHEQVRGLFETRIAKERVDYARFVGDQRLDIYEFERYGVDELMQIDMAAIRKGRPKRLQVAQQADNVVKFPTKRANGEA